MRYPINNAGFSLIELMVVLAIVGIVSAMAVPNLAGFISSQAINEAAQTVAGALKKARETAVSKNILTQVWISDDGTAAGRIYVIYREPVSGETLTSTDTVTANKNGTNVTLYAVEQGVIYPKGDIGMRTKATTRPSGGSAIGQTSLQFTFTSRGTASAVQNGDTTVYLMPDKEYTSNTRKKMRAITVSGTTGRVRIYTWGGSSWN